MKKNYKAPTFDVITYSLQEAIAANCDVKNILHSLMVMITVWILVLQDSILALVKVAIHPLMATATLHQHLISYLHRDLTH